MEGTDTDALFKFKTTLFGNIGFVGELNRRGLLQESIILSVFDTLLGVETKGEVGFINDNTIEGATVLMNKIGILLDNKLKQIEASMENTEKPPKKGDVETAAKIQRTFARF